MKIEKIYSQSKTRKSHDGSVGERSPHIWNLKPDHNRSDLLKQAVTASLLNT